MHEKYPVLVFALTTLAMAGPHTATAEEGATFAIVGGGVAVMPDYEGSDDYKASALPLLALGWQATKPAPEGGTVLRTGPHDVTLSFPSGLEAGIAKLYRPEGEYRLSLGLGYAFGRDEGENIALRGMGDIDGHVTGKIGLDFDAKNSGWECALELEKALSSDSDGLTVNGKLGHAMNLSQRVILTPALQATWADDDHMQRNFGVSAAQAASSAYALYNAQAGFKSAGLEAQLLWVLDANWMVIGKAEYTQLMNDAADSPLVKDQGSANQYGGLAALQYKF